MKLFYHGTSEEIGREINAYGLCPQDKKLIWNCSDPDSTYFFNDELDEVEHEGFYRALESAQISAAFHNSQSTSVAVVILEVPTGSQLEHWIEPDESCQYMDRYAVSIDNEAIHRAIVTGAATLHVVFPQDIYAPGFRYFYLAGMPHNLLNKSDLTDFEQRSIELAVKMNSCEIFEILIGEPISCAGLPEVISDMDKLR